MSKSIAIDKRVVEAVKTAPKRVRSLLALAVLMYSDDDTYEPDEAVAYEFGLLKPIIDRRRSLSLVRKSAAESRWKKEDASDLHMQNECKMNANRMQNTCKSYAKFKEILTIPTTVEQSAKRERTKERNLQEKKTPSIEGVKEKTVSPPLSQITSDPFPEIESPFPSEAMIAFQKWLRDKCPFLAENLRMPDEMDLARLKDRYSPSELGEILREIENHKDFREQKSDIYGAVISWTSKEFCKHKSKYEGN